MTDPSTTVFIALGTNLGDRRENLETAMEFMEDFVTITGRSKIYETTPMYITDQPNFLNMAVRGTTALGPEELLDRLKTTERRMGRSRNVRNGPRLIDMDILYYGTIVQEMDHLTLPHPRIAERDFVLHPLWDLAPDWRDPRTGKTVTEMVRGLEKSNHET